MNHLDLLNKRRETKEKKNKKKKNKQIERDKKFKRTGKSENIRIYAYSGWRAGYHQSD